MGQKFHLAILGHAEKHAAARTDYLTGFDITGQDQPRCRGANVEPSRPGTLFGQLCDRDVHARIGGITGRGALVDISLADEAARYEGAGTVELRLRQFRVRAIDLYLCGERANLLCLDRPLDHRENLPGANPIARLDQHTRYLPALTDDSDGHFHPRSE